MNLDFGMHTRPYGLSMQELQDLWRRGEAMGFDWISVFDHFYGGAAENKGVGTYECLTTLTALAATTERVRIGCMVLCMLYRPPAVLAKSAVTIDHLSQGRLELGLGAGWLREEFEDFGYAFPPVGERLTRLEEGVRMLQALFTGQEVSFSGTHYTLDKALCLPMPVKGRIPIWIGGMGEKRTLRMAAQLADGWNSHDIPPDVFRHKSQVLEMWCGKEGRDPATIRRSVNLGFQMGADEAGAARKRKAVEALPESRRHGELVGRAPEVIDRLGAYAEAGLNQVNIGLPGPVDWDALQAFVEDVMPAFRDASPPR